MIQNIIVNNYILLKYSGFPFSDLPTKVNIISLNSRLVTKPCFIYEKPLENRYIIKIDTYEFSGIYLWYNNTNGKCYIGSAVNLYRRISNYFQIAHLKCNYPIITAINKYGLNSFT